MKSDPPKNVLPGQANYYSLKLIDDRMRHGGENITDEEAGEIMGLDCMDPTGRGRRYITVAQRICLREHGLNWVRIHGAGYLKCQNSKETLAQTQRNLKSIRRRTKRETIRLRTIKSDELDTDEIKQARALSAQLGVIATIAENATAKRLEARDIPKVDPKRLLQALVKD